jgi:hypothetical protein
MKSHYKKILNNDGIINIPKVISKETSAKAIAVIEQILKNRDEDLLFTNTGVERKICYAFQKDEIFLDIISNPKVIEILKDIYGDQIGNILPTWEDILIKKPICGIPVEVHQDLGLPSINIGEVFSLSFYLNESKDNPVYYIKGSHKLGALTRNEIQKYQGKELFTPYFANIGDINIHNVLTVHYSDSNKSLLPRYTWYVEFRTIEQILNDSPWNLEWALKRQAILAYAIENRKKKGLVFSEIDFTRKNELNKYFENIELKVPHIGEGIEYIDNEYNHFKDHKSLF